MARRHMRRHDTKREGGRSSIYGKKGRRSKNRGKLERSNDMELKQSKEKSDRIDVKLKIHGGFYK